MRNFKDLSRALASIAGGLKSIKDIIDTIEPGGGGVGGINYSTTEQDTGLKWTDGTTPIYQITIAGTTPNAAAGTVDFPEDLSIAIPIETKGIIGPIANNQETWMVPDCKGSTVYVQTDERKIYFDNGDANFRNKPFYITIRYTKPSE